MKDKQPKIYVISDTHFNHSTMIKEQWRNFKNVEVMNEYMIKRWNQVVGNNDTVYHLGDVCLNNKTHYCKHIEPKLNGNIIYIKGNHDSLSLSRQFNTVIKFKGKMIELVHNPKDAVCVYDYCLHGHIHRNDKHDIGGVFAKHPRFYNCNVEFHKYTPKLLNEILGDIELAIKKVKK